MCSHIDCRWIPIVSTPPSPPNTTPSRSVYVVTRKAAGFGMGYVGGRMEVAKGTHLVATYVMSQKNKVRWCSNNCRDD